MYHRQEREEKTKAFEDCNEVKTQVQLIQEIKFLGTLT